MGTFSMGDRLEQCRSAYEKAGPLVRTQISGFMVPLLGLLEQAAKELEQGRQEREQLAMALTVANDAIRALDGSKAQTCNGGACSTCTGHGNTKTGEGHRSTYTRAAEPAQRWPFGLQKSSSDQGSKGKG